MRAYKTVNDSYIEPISFIVPRRAETFQEDIYPPTVGLKPAMSSAEWFDGAEGLPPKISLESIYDGTGMKEVPAEAPKPASKAPEPVKAPEPKKEVVKPTPEPTPTPTTLRSPPPTMKEQGATMMSAADKFQDTEPVEDDADDGSSFEEVQKPVERTSAVTPAVVETKKEEPTPVASSVWEDVETPEPKAVTPTSKVRLYVCFEEAQLMSNRPPRLQARHRSLWKKSLPLRLPRLVPALNRWSKRSIT
jgi:coronin-1B/1C/6